MKEKVITKVYDIVTKTFVRMGKASIRRQKRAQAFRAVAAAYSAR